jgi:hypothetical protein
VVQMIFLRQKSAIFNPLSIPFLNYSTLSFLMHQSR